MKHSVEPIGFSVRHRLPPSVRHRLWKQFSVFVYLITRVPPPPLLLLLPLQLLQQQQYVYQTRCLLYDVYKTLSRHNPQGGTHVLCTRVRVTNAIWAKMCCSEEVHCRSRYTRTPGRRFGRTTVRSPPGTPDAGSPARPYARAVPGTGARRAEGKPISVGGAAAMPLKSPHSSAGEKQ